MEAVKDDKVDIDLSDSDDNFGSEEMKAGIDDSDVIPQTMMQGPAKMGGAGGLLSARGGGAGKPNPFEDG